MQSASQSAYLLPRFVMESLIVEIDEMNFIVVNKVMFSKAFGFSVIQYK